MSGTKLVLVGEGCVGKTSFIRLLMNLEFESKYTPTLGLQVFPWNNYSCYDTAGEKRFWGLKDGYYIGAKLAIIMVDATSKSTANSIKTWYEDLLRICPNVKIGIVVNKIDCLNVSKSAIKISKTFAQENNLKYLEISVKTSINELDIIEFLNKL